MPLFGLFGVLELIFLAGFFILLIVGASLDRRGNESPKWYIFGVGVAAIIVYFWKDFSLGGVWELVTSWTLWEPLGAYLLAGLVYSILEFVLEVRRTARYYKESWTRALNRNVEVKQLDANGMYRRETVQGHRGPTEEVVTKTMTARELISERHEPSNVKPAEEHVDHFIVSEQRRYGFVGLTRGAEGTPEPQINKLELAESIGAWTFFWPAYAVSLLIGDLLTEVFNVLAEALVKMSGRFVRFSFADVFKLS